MNPLMRDFIEPAPDVGVGGGDVQRQTRALERGCQWRNETAFEVAVETLDLTLGFCAIGPANARPKAVFVGQCQQSRMPAMLASTIAFSP